MPRLRAESQAGLPLAECQGSPSDRQLRAHAGHVCAQERGEGAFATQGALRVSLLLRREQALQDPQPSLHRLLLSQRDSALAPCDEGTGLQSQTGTSERCSESHGEGDDSRLYPGARSVSAGKKSRRGLLFCEALQETGLMPRALCQEAQGGRSMEGEGGANAWHGGRKRGGVYKAPPSRKTQPKHLLQEGIGKVSSDQLIGSSKWYD